MNESSKKIFKKKKGIVGCSFIENPVWVFKPLAKRKAARIIQSEINV
jgi:hypothetical protein